MVEECVGKSYEERPILARCWQSSRKECIHLSRRGWMFKAAIFFRTVEWSTWSKAILLSTNKAGMELWSSNVSCHICVISIKACIVERPRSAPNCLTSNLSVTLESIHWPTNDSSISLSVGVREIGCKLSWMDFGRHDFGTSSFPETWTTACTDWRIEYVYMWQIGSEAVSANLKENSLGCQLDLKSYEL